MQFQAGYRRECNYYDSHVLPWACESLRFILVYAGTVGHPVGLMANYFALNKLPNWALRRYRVDIAPDEDRTSERVQLLRVHREQLGGYLFDGTVLFTINALTSPQVIYSDLILTF